MAKTFENTAAELAREIRATGHGFLTLSKEQLRNRFDIGRLTANLSSELVEALGEVDLVVSPFPADAGQSLRVYDLRHPLGGAAFAICSPDETTDSALRELADLVSRTKAGRELRSDDVPWLEGLHMLLQLVLGREPAGWEDLRNDRHSSELAHALAGKLGVDVELLGNPRMLRLAALADTYRPLERRFREDELVLEADSAPAVGALLHTVETAQRRMAEQHMQVLIAVGKMLIRGTELPNAQVEVGLLGLRRRRERTV